MRIGIVGPGRLGRSLAVLLGAAGHDVVVRGRGQPPPDAPVVLLTVPDDAIGAVARAVPPGRIVLHCSGASDVDVLRPHAPAGSLHPLMSFPGPDVAIPPLAGVPAAVAGDPEAVEVARSLAADLGLEPFEVPGDRRLYHAAAVMAGNFATVLLAEAATVLAAAGVDPARAPGLLAPLAIRSIQQAARDPAAALTGPVARGDTGVIARHREALSEAGLTAQAGLYDTLTDRARQVAGRSPTGGPGAGAPKNEP